ncbi:MAG: alpha/beta hydrolase [Chloroflexi bacterium HGW-Chloroflexi-4]|jgi:pimeloyl-ACP methyl ester carboxylesterase|nr:MAG: alpha/beta hydrolase [Chloroflexi bacterium HGW-Chloroflexi-4]
MLNILRKVGKTLMYLLASILICLLFILVYLIIVSPGKFKPFKDEDGNILTGSISEKIMVNINGVNQGMFIQSKDLAHPVLLFLHGGLPETFLIQKYPTGLEDYFTVEWWEQRGSGISYNADIPIESLTLEQMISDTLMVTNFLRHRFEKEKIYLLGHSGGTFIGIQAASQAPELYYAYIGEAQMTYQLKSEKLAYEYMLKEFQENNNQRMVQKLEAAPVTMADEIPDVYLTLRDGTMHSLGIGTMHEMKSVENGIFLPSLTFRGYTLLEKFNLWKSKSQSGVSPFWDEMINTDLNQKVAKLEIPVYFFSGIYDYTCSYSLAKEYFEKLQAPIKGFYTFEQSAHSPMFEEPERFLEIMVNDVSNGKVILSDK